MFEKFTQKALDIVVNAQIEAGNSGADKVYSEHFLIGLADSMKGVQARLLGLNEISIDELKQKATYITDSCDKDGIYNACKHFGWIE